MTDERLSAEKFDHIADQQCWRWSSRTVQAARASLVDGRSAAAVAASFEMSRQQVYVLRKRFLDLARKAVKVPAAAFMAAVSPDWNTALVRFEPHIRSLIRSGYSPAQVADYLKANDVDVPFNELSSYLGELK